VGRSRLTGRALQRSEHKAVILIGDLAALTAAVLTSLWLWSITAGFPFSTAFLRAHRIWFLAVPAWAIALAPAYGVRIALSVVETVGRLLQAAALLLGAYLALYFYSPRYQLPRLMGLYIFWEGFLLVLAWRLLYAWFFSRDLFARRVLIVGAGQPGLTALRLIRDSDFRNSTVVALLDAPGTDAETSVEGVPVVREPATLVDCARDLGVDEIVLAHASSQTELFAGLVECQELGIEIVTMPQAYEDLLHRVPVQHLDSSWLFTSFVESVRAKDSSLVAKRALDILGALVGLVILVAWTPFLALGIWLDSGRPIFFRQVRTGRGGRNFVMLKLRTMVPDAERDTGPQWSLAGDSRVTRAGRILRRLRLDELPNLVNVLRGDMSLVGPRPERPELVRLLARDIPFYRTRLIVRPGLTGWAQVNHPYGDSVEDAAQKLEYDLYYLKHRSMLFDLRILLRTAGTVFRLGGR
jgi:exopolysaccharide biosynthesis polyprenyl glycosylphosphotransferase